MNNLKIEATKATPRIYFDYQANLLEIEGKCYPDNPDKFFERIFSWFNDYIKILNPTNQKVTVNIHLTYFNSSSSQILYDFFILLEKEVKNGKNISVNWIFHEDDEESQTLGEEFQEDIEMLEFNFVKLET